MLKKAVLFLFALLLAVSVWATSLVCSIDRGRLTWTGQTKIDPQWAVMLYQHKCISGHYYWLTKQQMDQ